MAEMIRGIYLAENDLARIAEVPDELNTWYEMLDCDCIDIAVRRIGDKEYDIICDDVGLIDNRPFTMVSEQDGVWYKEIFGSVFICNNDGQGNLKGLTEDEVDNVFNHIAWTMVDDEIRHFVVINWEGYDV